MARFRADDGAMLFYRYYSPSSSPHRPAASTDRQPLTLVFLHGWPMSSRMFDQLIVPLVETHRYPVIAPDRRGFGNSDWSTPSTGEVTLDTFVSDAVNLLENVLQQNPGPFVFIAASMGTAESVLVRATSNLLRLYCKGFVWIGPNMPYTVSCEECPGAPSAEVWDSIIQGFRGAGGKDFIAQAVPGIFRVDLGNQVGQDTLQFFERLVQQADPVAVERTAVVLQISTAGELKNWAEAAAADEREKVPVLILHGDSDAGMPLETSAAIVQKLLPWSQLKVYEKAGHGLYLTHAQQVVDDILAFLEPIASQQRQ
ncbi:Alpha/Beta hydrolase protein [Parachaetomium inaequale]|uniref:Alpha/Beta hydrolase protein n=1 Tax=Parachaetomium inaequale TaxID=2588326 RepID=A0AAN6PG48_9PEZI|nr:Alpha/Beta hydrolase protein [Parachaetomium inaequale]